MDDLLARVYQAFDPSPLEPEEDDLYIELDDVRGEAGVVARLAKRIQLSGDEYTCQLLAGHHGSGKSTELKRLKRELETGENPFFVVYCEAKSDLDVNDVDFPEVLIAIVHQLARQLEEQVGIKLKPGYFKDRWERLKKVLGSEVGFEEFELQTGLFNLAGVIKSSPDARAKIREALEPEMGHLLIAANDVIGEATLELTKKKRSGLVILVDDLDKIVLRPHEASKCSTAEYLFVHRQPQLSAFKCHLVYTMPLSLAYSAHQGEIASRYGARVPVIPMTKIAKRPPKRGRYEPGFDCFRQIIEARLKSVEVEERTVFENDSVRDRLIELSGGQPRELMIMIREAIVSDTLPIRDAAVDRTEREGQRSYARLLMDEHSKIVESVRKNGVLKRTKANEDLVRELLDSRAILQYVNDDEWYGVNPLIRKAAPKAKVRKSK